MNFFEETVSNDKLERPNASRIEYIGTLKALHDELVEKVGKNKVTIRPSTDGDILEVTAKNVYIRVVAGESKNRQKPFSFYRYVSTATPDKPKTVIYERQKRPVTPMDADELRIELEKLFPKASQMTPLIEGPRVPVSTEGIHKSSFRDTFYVLGDLEKLRSVCVPEAVVIIRHLGFEDGHARSKVRIKEIKENNPPGSLSAKMEFLEPVPLRE
ncbi:hypothetical protein HY417_03330 [Candidatus Kaiserbacteria bacterium]|nr:hypothetical protein [Candidatus Kaiserbacteria bacterium]